MHGVCDKHVLSSSRLNNMQRMSVEVHGACRQHSVYVHDGLLWPARRTMRHHVCPEQTVNVDLLHDEHDQRDSVLLR